MKSGYLLTATVLSLSLALPAHAQWNKKPKKSEFEETAKTITDYLQEGYEAKSFQAGDGAVVMLQKKDALVFCMIDGRMTGTTSCVHSKKN